MKRNVCVFKTGYSELLEPHAGGTVSLGDVFRTTVLLHLFENDNITWLTSPQGVELLAGNPHIHEIVVWDRFTVPAAFHDRKFDLLINLEKDEALCRLAEEMNAEEKIGFRRAAPAGRVAAFNSGAQDIINLSGDFSLRNGEGSPCFQQSLFHMIGIREWAGENYILAKQPETVEKYDVGFNTEVGAKWPTKRWPATHWEELFRILDGKGLSISRQQGLNNLSEYTGWINMCRLLVTNDSLCIHLAQALEKKVVMLVGPTFSSEIYIGAGGMKLVAETDCPKNPCFSGTCGHTQHCMETIAPADVAGVVLGLMRPKYNGSCVARV